MALRQNTLTFHNLETLLTIIEGIVNTRPITYVSEDPSDLQAITPAQLLTGKDGKHSLKTLPKKQKIGRMHRLRMKIAGTFWKRWQQEYLKKLLPYKKWLELGKNLKIGDLVLLEDKFAAKSFWPLGRVVKVWQGNDSNVRVVLLQTEKWLVKRGVQTLYLLEEATEDHLQLDTDAKENQSQPLEEKSDNTQKPKEVKKSSWGRTIKPNPCFACLSCSAVHIPNWQ